MAKPKKPRTPRKARMVAPKTAGFIAFTCDGEFEIAADRWTKGTDYVQFFKGDLEVAFFRTQDCGNVEPISGQTTELLAEVRAEGETTDSGNESEPDPDPDETPREPPGELPRDSG